MHRSLLAFALLASVTAGAQAQELKYYDLAKGDYPHDVAVGPNGEVWYRGAEAGIAGRLNPATGQIERIPLGKNSAPHGVIVGPDGAPWFTDGGQNAIVRVDPATKEVKVWPLPPERMPYTNLNTAAFDGKGASGSPARTASMAGSTRRSGDMKVWDAPKGRGAYGITATPKGDIWFVSLAGSYLANVDLETGAATVYEPPTKDQGARRVWSDSKGGCGSANGTPATSASTIRPPRAGSNGSCRARSRAPTPSGSIPDDKVWLADWAANAIVRFDPVTEKFESFPSDRPAPTCARCSAARARPGSPNRAPSASASSAILRKRTEARARA